jgi:hypothetical protein
MCFHENERERINFLLKKQELTYRPPTVPLDGIEGSIESSNSC